MSSSRKVIALVTVLLFNVLLNACAMGPDYETPCIEIPAHFKEAPKGWKYATPEDDCDRGAWWEVFKDDTLNGIMARVNCCNQNIASYYAQYLQSRALVDQYNAAFYPTVIYNASVVRQKVSTEGGTGFNSSNTTNLNPFNNPNFGTGTRTSGSSNSKNPFTTYSTSVTATWVPDLWGSVSRQVEAGEAGAESSAAQVSAITLSMQGTAAQNYFLLRNLDADQQLLDMTVKDYEKMLEITKNRYSAGTAQRLDVLQAESQLDTAKAQALDNRIARAQYEHAIAVLMGLPPSEFCLAPAISRLSPPNIPLSIPSCLLERRPDIAQAERLVAEANANIGVATAAFFPTITLTGTPGYQSNHLSRLFTEPASFWSIGAQLAQTLYDGGVLIAKRKIACATYDQMVASYRQTVLSAFQNVEDSLVQLRILKKEIVVHADAVDNADAALKITINQYKAGIAQYADVILAQNTLYTARKTLLDLKGRQMVSAVGLIMAMGGGWDRCTIVNAGCRDYEVPCP